MKPSRIAVEVATRYLQSQGGSDDAPRSLLQAVEEAQSVLHGAVQHAAPPGDVSIEEHKALSRIVRAVKAMHEQSEEIRLELDEWIIDYAEAREVAPPER